MSKVVVAPSILAADIGKLEAEIKDIEAAGADWLHVDVMDGHFVPPITFGDNVVARLKKCTKLFLDTHLMVAGPERHFENFAKAGSDRLIVHQETCPHLHLTLEHITKLGMKNGVAINPGTPVDTVFDVLGAADLLLIMTVNPGWGGQAFIPHTLEKIGRASEFIKQNRLNTVIEVDGGINADTAKECRLAGASVLVAGSYVFGAKDRAQAISSLRG